MEDLKKYLAILAKHSFWILTGLILAISSVFFFLTKTSLDQAIDARKSSLKGTYDKIKGVEGKVGTHPNEFSHKEMQVLIDGLKKDVDAAWRFQYERQTELLTWPKEAFWQPRTREIFENLRPFESMVPYPIPTPAPPPLDLITTTDRSVYKDFIAPEFPDLARRIGSTWKFALDANRTTTKPPSSGKSFGGVGGMDLSQTGRTSMPEVETTRDLVRWSAESQEALAASVLPWFVRATPPDPHEIYYAQEDIWILKGLMDIIAKTNAGANENFQAIVKEIEWIATGPRAFRDAGALSDAGPAGVVSTGENGSFKMRGNSGGASGSGGGSLGTSFKGLAEAVAVDPADGRYVDANLQPLTGAQLRAAIKEVNPNAVAKRVQVRMRLKVDDRFGKLITECGNGKMMLEVLQVRYNTEAAASGTGSGFGGGGGGGGGRGGFKKGLAGLGGGSDAEGADSSPNVKPVITSDGEVSIEIYGLIYLYNPPPSLSKVESEATDSTADQPVSNVPSDEAANPANDPKPNPTADAPTAEPPPGEATPENLGGEEPSGEGNATPVSPDPPAGEGAGS